MFTPVWVSDDNRVSMRSVYVQYVRRKPSKRLYSCRHMWKPFNPQHRGRFVAETSFLIIVFRGPVLIILNYFTFFWYATFHEWIWIVNSVLREVAQPSNSWQKKINYKVWNHRRLVYKSCWLVLQMLITNQNTKCHTSPWCYNTNLENITLNVRACKTFLQVKELIAVVVISNLKKRQGALIAKAAQREH